MLYDKPPSFYQKASATESARMAEDLHLPELSGPDRPAILVSSTSWTEDENFDMLLDAMVALDDTINVLSD